ncbi:MAG: sigma-54 dependent transcriptional regulator [Pseudomonadota bacterium]
MTSILVIDDNPDILEALKLLLDLQGYRVVTAATAKEGLILANQQSIDLVIQDMNFSHHQTDGSEGNTLFFNLRQQHPNLPIVLLTAWGHIESAVALVKAGAVDYLTKPWDDNKLLRVIEQHISTPSEIMHSQRVPSNLIYQSDVMAQLMNLATRVAHSSMNLLITGPNGSGKEKLADYIHQHSDRVAKPFIKVNMGALPDDLMEAELFGAEKGAFTGAQTQRQGRFEVANGGTLFLDEIGNLNLKSQMKLLRVLQTGEFERLGSNDTQKVDVRVISATNANLPQAIANGTFREDLFYRINALELTLPALNDRREDIVALATHFIGDEHTLAMETQTYLKHRDWPGNVRELENACQRAKVFGEQKTLTPQDFELHPITAIHGEQEHFQKVLDKHDWVIARAAAELGLSRQALYRRIAKYQLKPSS